MALRAFVALLAVAQVHSARVKPQVKAMAPSREELTPGTAVTDRRGRLAGTVDSVEEVTMVTVKSCKFGRCKQIKLPLDSVRLAEPQKDDKPKPKPQRPPQRPGSNEDEDSGSTGGDPMSIRQKIVCDVCLKKVTSCGRYVPTLSMLSPVFGAPESPNGRYYNCPASERAKWSTDLPVKVWDEGYSVGYEGREGYRLESAKNMTAEGDRSLCKGERRASPVDGTLTLAKRICKQGLQWRSFDTCTELVREKAAVGDRKPVCTSANVYIYDK